MIPQRYNGDTDTISRKRTANVRRKTAKRANSPHFVIFNGQVISSDRIFDAANTLDEASDDTFDKSAYDLLVEADEFLQTRLPQFRDRHPYEQ